MQYYRHFPRIFQIFVGSVWLWPAVCYNEGMLSKEHFTISDVIEDLRKASVMDKDVFDKEFQSDDADSGTRIPKIYVLSEAPGQVLAKWRQYFGLTDRLCVAIVASPDNASMAQVLRPNMGPIFADWEKLYEKFPDLARKEGYPVCRQLLVANEVIFPKLVEAVRNLGLSTQKKEHYSPVVLKAFHESAAQTGESDIVPRPFDPFEL